MSFSTVCIVGSGPTATGLAIACSLEAVPVTLVRAVRGSLDSTRERLTRRLDAYGDAGLIPAARRSLVDSLVRLTSDLAAAGDADLVIDAARREPKARRAILATLESRISAGAVLATCAEPEQLASIAEVLRRPDQLVGMRFFHPGTLDVRVELAVLPETAPGVIGACRTFCASLGRQPLERASLPPRVGYREWIFQPPSTPDLPRETGVVTRAGTRRTG